MSVGRKPGDAPTAPAGIAPEDLTATRSGGKPHVSENPHSPGADEARKPRAPARTRANREPECDASHSHATLAAAMDQMPDADTMFDLAALFKLFADPTRIKILCALCRGELCVCELASLLHMTQSAISHQLRFLKDGRAVKSRRDGKQVWYSLHDNHVTHIFDEGLIHIGERLEDTGP